MKRRTRSRVLPCALSVALLSACGGKGSDGSVSGSSSGSLLPDGSVSSSASEGPAQPDTSAPDQSQPDASSPDGSQPDAVQEPSATASLSLNKNSFTLSKAGATYRLKYTLSPEGGKVTFSSSDEKVATVNGKGTVTAVAPGSAVITVTSGKLTAQCTVKCSWKAAEKPAESAKPSAPSQSAQDKLPAQEEKAVDLAAFVTKIDPDPAAGRLYVHDEPLSQRRRGAGPGEGQQGRGRSEGHSSGPHPVHGGRRQRPRRRLVSRAHRDVGEQLPHRHPRQLCHDGGRLRVRQHRERIQRPVLSRTQI